MLAIKTFIRFQRKKDDFTEAINDLKEAIRAEDLSEEAKLKLLRLVLALEQAIASDVLRQIELRRQLARAEKESDSFLPDLLFLFLLPMLVLLCIFVETGLIKIHI